MPHFKELYYEEPPPGAGTALLLLHGLGANRYSWRHLLPELPAGYRPYVIDLKGFGKAHKPADQSYSIRDQAELVVGLIQALNLGPVSIVGHSMGGGVALMTALTLLKAGRPVERLVLVDAVSYPVPSFGFLGSAWFSWLAMLAAPLLPARFLIGTALRQASFDASKVTPDMVDAYAAPLGEPGGREALRKAATNLFPPDLESVSAGYTSILALTLVLWGRQDEVLPLDNGKKLAGALPNARLDIVENCGHIPQEEKPEDAIPKIVAFLAS